MVAIVFVGKNDYISMAFETENYQRNTAHFIGKYNNSRKIILI